LFKDGQRSKTKDRQSKWFSENVGKSLYSSCKKIKPFNLPSGIKILAAGGEIQTAWFVTDFMLGPDSTLGRGTRINNWRWSFFTKVHHL